MVEYNILPCGTIYCAIPLSDDLIGHSRFWEWHVTPPRMFQQFSRPPSEGWVPTLGSGQPTRPAIPYREFQ